MKHVVVGIISQTNTRSETEYLLVSVVKDSFGEYSGAYYPPGGHLEDGEDEGQALIREIKEELNITIEPVTKLAETAGDVNDQMTHWWTCRVISGELRQNKKELSDARFFTRDEMKNIRLWPATERFFDEHIFVSSPSE